MIFTNFWLFVIAVALFAINGNIEKYNKNGRNY